MAYTINRMIPDTGIDDVDERARIGPSTQVQL